MSSFTHDLKRISIGIARIIMSPVITVALTAISAIILAIVSVFFSIGYVFSTASIYLVRFNKYILRTFGRK